MLTCQKCNQDIQRCNKKEIDRNQFPQIPTLTREPNYSANNCEQHWEDNDMAIPVPDEVTSVYLLK